MLTIRLLSLSLLLAVFTSTLQAQQSAASGTPAFINDSIYKLAVNPADYAEKDAVVLFEDEINTIEANGSSKTTYRTVTQVLSDEKVRELADDSFSWTVGRENFTLHWARVVRPNGEVISAKPSFIQETESTSPVKGGPATKRIKMSLSGITPGTIVDVSYTREYIKPYIRGSIGEGWFAHYYSDPVRLSRFVVNTPKSLNLDLEEWNLSSPKTVRDSADRRIYRWIARNLPKVIEEEFSYDSANVNRHGASLTLLTAWDAIAARYDSVTKNSYVMTPVVRAKVAELVIKSKTLDDSIRAVHKWIVQEIKPDDSVIYGNEMREQYVTLALDSIVINKTGGTEDKAALFIAIMRDWHIPASPALVRYRSRRETKPQHGILDGNVLAAMPYRGREIYVDLREPYFSFDEMSIHYRNASAFKIKDGGTGEFIPMPNIPADSNGMYVTLVGSLSADGNFSGKMVQLFSGDLKSKIRREFAREIKKEELEEATKGMASMIFEGGTGDSLEIFNGKDLSITPRISIVVNNAKAGTMTGGYFVLSHSSNPPFSTSYIQMLESKPPRKLWIDASDILPYQIISGELRMTLPEGWTATLPKNVIAKSPFGTYESTYEQQGRVLIVHHKMVGADAILPPTAMPDLLAWMKQVASDKVQYILLKPGA